jgi:signal peptidase I
MKIVVSLFDRQFLLAFDNQPIFTFPIAEDIKRNPAIAEQFALGAQGLNVKIDELKVFRDLYYTEPIGRTPYGWGEVPARLGEEAYYVLGDNSSISEDSRTWGPHSPVLSNSLLGKPLAVIFPAQPGSWLGRQFQIPDWRRIRYIR